MITVDFWADVRCPWCWIGHRRLAAAIGRLRAPVEVRYHSFLLEPRGPSGARDTVGAVAVAEWGMTTASWAARRDRIEQAGRADGLTIRIDSARTIDSRPAHRVLKLAASRGADRARAWETMFAAHLEHNSDLEDWDQLAELGADLGLRRGDVLALADSDEHVAEVGADHRAATDRGIGTVPTVEHTGKTLSGVHSVIDLTAFLSTPTGEGTAR